MLLSFLSLSRLSFLFLYISHSHSEFSNPQREQKTFTFYFLGNQTRIEKEAKNKNKKQSSMSTTTIGAIAAARRPKWHYPPPPPTPRILHLPRRPRRKATKNSSHPGKPVSAPAGKKDRKGKLETLFDEERVFTRASVPIVLLDYGGESERRRKRVEEEESGCGGGLGVEEEKWRFQAEMMRAECNLLRMEKQIAVKKLHRTRVKMEKTLRSAVRTLISVSPFFFLCFS